MSCTSYTSDGLRVALSKLRYEIITRLSDWLAHREEITELLSTSTVSNPHTTMSWLTTWWTAFGDAHELQIGLFWDDRGQLVGYAPLMLSRYRFLGVPYRLLHFVGEGLSDYADIFSRADDNDIKTEMVRILLAEWNWDDLLLMNVRENSSTLMVLKQVAGAERYLSIRPNTRCLYIDLRGTTFRQYYKALSRNHRRELQKRKHKLDALGSWSLEFNPQTDSAGLFERFRSIHTWRAREQEWISLYEDSGFRQFFCALLDESGSDLKILYSTLECGETLLAYSLGFVADSVYYHWNIGFNGEYDYVSPGKLHHQFLIEECFQRGYDEFNFMRGDAEYKYKWTQSFRQNFRVRLLRRSGWRNVVNQIQWIKEREPGSRIDRLIRPTVTIYRLLGAMTTRRRSRDEGEGQDED